MYISIKLRRPENFWVSAMSCLFISQRAILDSDAGILNSHVSSLLLTVLFWYLPWDLERVEAPVLQVSVY